PRKKPLIFNSGAQVPIRKVVFCEELTDNLLSVSRLTEEGHTVVFKKGSYTIYKGEVHIKGKVVHQQDRKPQSGLFPLTLYQDPREGHVAKGSPLNCQEGWCLLERRFMFFCTPGPSKKAREKEK